MKFLLTAAGMCLAGLVLSGCAGAGPGTPTGEGSDAPETSAPPAGVCDILTTDDVGAAFGAGFAEGDSRTGEESVDGVEWTTTGCGWEGDGVEVVATVALAADFPAGFVCVEPSSLDGEVEPLDGIGTRAWWAWDDFQGGTGTVIVCGDDTRVVVEAEGPREGPAIDEAATKGAATTLATSLIDAVG